MGPRGTGPLVLIAGGSSEAGVATAQALVAAGCTVLSVSSDAARGAAAAARSGAHPFVCDLRDADAVADLRTLVHAKHGTLDALIHLVGGWRGGQDLAAQSDADFDFLSGAVLATLRITSRAFYADLAAAPQGRLAIVSSSAVTAPTLGNANYAAVKAAAETWVLALAEGLARDSAAPDGAPRAAAVVLVVKALVDEGMRARFPARRFPGFTSVTELGDTIVRLLSTPAHELNGHRLDLTQEKAPPHE